MVRDLTIMKPRDHCTEGSVRFFLCCHFIGFLHVIAGALRISTHGQDWPNAVKPTSVLKIYPAWTRAEVFKLNEMNEKLL